VVREIASGGCARFKENRAKNGTHVRAVLPPMIAGGPLKGASITVRVKRKGARRTDHGTGQAKGTEGTDALKGASITVRVKRNHASSVNPSTGNRPAPDVSAVRAAPAMSVRVRARGDEKEQI